MDKRGIGFKGVFSYTKEDSCIEQTVYYNHKTDYIGIYTRFRKIQGFHNGSITNKNCSLHLGVTIAEQLLAKVFNYVERMPNGNVGFDFKCNQGYMIDVKSAVQGRKWYNWVLRINRNQIADYFLCLAFDNRQQLNPLHLWLIPSKRIAHLTTLTISQSTIDKWSEFELIDKLDKVIACCNIMRDN